MNEKLKEIINYIPLFKQMTGTDAAIAVWNHEGEVIAYFKSDSINMNFDVGFKADISDKSEGSVYHVINSGKQSYNKIPKEVFGVAIEGTMTPIMDEGKVVGAITYAFATEVKEGILNSANALADSIIDTDKSIEKIIDNTKVLSSNMIEVKDVTDSVIEKVDEAIEVVQTIKQNAKLSNILALNASIESARAGEAGKGFAVVSDEMRKFAIMSSEASEKISKSLGEIVKSLTDVKVSVDSSKDIAVEQSESVNELNIIFSNVTEKANETIDICRQIKSF